MFAKYLEYCELDKKPEKGERKFADDIILLIAQILEDNIIKINNSKKSFKYDLLKICLLEHAYDLSNYNYDILIYLLKSYNRLGLCTSFWE